MNIKEKRNDTARQYHVPGMPNYTSRKRNAIHFSKANSKPHEMGKASICYDLLAEGKSFITEAVHNKTGYRRDVVCLDSGNVYEIETDPKRAKRFENQEGVILVIKLWEEKK